MGAFRVVVYAEGVGETKGSLGQMRAPGERIPDDDLGSAHLIVRRCLAEVRSLPHSAILFEEPLRTRSRIARGSDLLNERTLEQLLSWPRAGQKPDLAVVLVDCDGDARRRETLIAAVAKISVAKVIGMAVQEFESWLIADHGAVAKVIGVGPRYPGPPESLKPREAKKLLTAWATDAGIEDESQMRRELANTCSLERISSHCSSFARFMDDLK